MKVIAYNEMIRAAKLPITQPEVSIGQPLFVRCLRPANSPPSPIINQTYLVKSVIENTVNNNERAFLYKIDGYAMGIKSEKAIPSTNFERWYPKQGDLLFLSGEQNPMLISRVEAETSSRRFALYLHRYDDESHEWRFHGRHQEPDVTPCFGIAVDRDVITAFTQVLDVTTTTIKDLGFTGNKGPQAPSAQPVVAAAPAPETDKARAHRIDQLKKSYQASLNMAVATGRQYREQTGESLPHFEQLSALMTPQAVAK